LEPYSGRLRIQHEFDHEGLCSLAQLTEAAEDLHTHRVRFLVFRCAYGVHRMRPRFGVRMVRIGPFFLNSCILQVSVRVEIPLEEDSPLTVPQVFIELMPEVKC
jgi:hypothetical protein